MTAEALQSRVTRPGFSSEADAFPKTIGLDRETRHLERQVSILNPNQKFAADITFWSTIVLPKFSELAKAKFPTPQQGIDLDEQRLTYMGGLVDAYRAIEAYPTDPLKQQEVMTKRGANEGT